MKPRSLYALVLSCFVLPLALLVPSLSGCAGLTAAQKATATGILSGIASAAPVSCAIVSLSGGNGTACSQDTAAASDVAQMVQSILAALPTAAPAASSSASAGMRMAEASPDAGAPAAPQPMVAFKIDHGSSDVDVTLPASLAAYVQAHYPAESPSPSL